MRIKGGNRQEKKEDHKEGKSEDKTWSKIGEEKQKTGKMEGGHKERCLHYRVKKLGKTRK